MATAFPDRSHGSSLRRSLHPLHVTPKPCRVHRQLLRRRSERRGHFRSLLAQFGLTPKSKRGLASSEAVDPL